jgi:hypothetical protein
MRNASRLVAAVLEIVALASCSGGGGDGGGGPSGGAPSLTAIDPAVVTRAESAVLLVVGSGIAAGASVTLSSCSTAVVYDLSATAAVAGDGRSVAATLLADPLREPGVYTVEVRNPGGASSSLPCALTIVASPRPTVTSVTPDVAYAGTTADAVLSETSVTIRGTGFESAPTVTWTRTDGSASYDARYVGYLSGTEIVAIAPAEALGMPAGDYHVSVTNPDLLSARWDVGGGAPGVFVVSATPPPRITALSPSRVELGTCTFTSVEIAGEGFGATAQAFYAVPDGFTCPPGTTTVAAGAETLCSMSTASVAQDGRSMTASFEACPGTGNHPILVRNPDRQLGSFDALEVTASADGMLHQGQFVELASTLVEARFKHGAVAAFDAGGRAFLYVAGGEGASGNVLGSVELAALDVRGDVGPFARALQADSYGTRVENGLRQPREGLALVAAGRTLLAIGGSASPTNTTTTVTATRSVERARVLGGEEVPALQIPTASGSGLPVGAWYYQVSALGPWGEGLPSSEVVALNVGGTLRVCWSPPSAPGVTGYNVYRSLAADGRAATTTLLARNVAGTCFDDDGQGPLVPAPARLRASVATGGSRAAGTYRYRVSGYVPSIGRETHASYEALVEITAADVSAGKAAVALRWEPVPAATEYFVRRLDPVTETFEVISVPTTALALTDGGLPNLAISSTVPVKVPPLPAGSVSRWEELDSGRWLQTAREGPDAVSVALDPALSGTLAARVFVVGGRPSNGAAPATTVESLGVGPDGSLDAGWTVEAATLTTGRSYLSLVGTQGHLEQGFRPPSPTAGPEFLAAVFGMQPGGTRATTIEACAVDVAGAGHLDCGTGWTVQPVDDPSGTFGAGAVFSYGYLLPFYGVDRQITGFPPTLLSAACSRFGVTSPLPTPPASTILDSRQSISAALTTVRGYYRLVPAMSSVYAIGGWTATGPTPTIERHAR